MSSDVATVVAAYACVVGGVALYAGYLALCQARLRRAMDEVRRIRTRSPSG